MKGRKTHEAKSQFVLTLLLIGREEDANFLDKLQTVLGKAVTDYFRDSPHSNKLPNNSIILQEILYFRDNCL